MNSKRKDLGPFFKIDPENGDFILLPIHTNSANRGQEKCTFTWRSREKPLMQLQCKASEISQLTKSRRAEKNVRKELFKPPKFESQQNSYPKSINRTLEKGAQKMKNQDISPKTTSEAIEFKEIPLGYTISREEQELKRVNSLDSISEYVIQEEICKDSNQSPASSVCGLLKDGMLKNSAQRDLKKADVVSQLKDILIADKTSFDEGLIALERCISDMKSQHKRNCTKIMTLISQLENESEGNKENSSRKRRSLRLLDKYGTSMKTPGSPVTLKSGNLRKSTLKKNFVAKRQGLQLDTLKIHKALEMYNSTRNICSALLTPKHSGKSDSEWRSNLSLKVQEQCILLQDTPHHN